MSDIDEKEFLNMVKEATYADYLEKNAKEALDKTEDTIKRLREAALKGSALGAGVAVGTLGGRYGASKINPISHPLLNKAVVYGSPLALSALAHIGQKAAEEKVSEDALDLATHGMLGGTAGMGLGGALGQVLKKRPGLGALIGGGGGTAAGLLASHLLDKKRKKSD